MFRKKKKGNITYSAVLTAPAMTIYTIFAIVPLVMALGLSFTDWFITRWNEPVFYGIENYVEVFTDEVFGTALFNTLLYAVGTTILKVVVGLALAMVLQKAFRGNSILRTIFYLPCVISVTVIGLLFTSILSMNGLLNNALKFFGMSSLVHEWMGSYPTAMFFLIFIESWMWAGFVMFIFISGLQAIPHDYYEAADLEGATPFQKFKDVTLPLVMPAMTVNATMSIAGGLKVFDIIYVLTKGGPGTDTQVLSTYAYRSFGTGALGESAAASIVLAVLVIGISFAMNSFFRKREVEV